MERGWSDRTSVQPVLRKEATCVSTEHAWPPPATAQRGESPTLRRDHWPVASSRTSLGSAEVGRPLPQMPLTL